MNEWYIKIVLVFLDVTSITSVHVASNQSLFLSHAVASSARKIWKPFGSFVSTQPLTFEKIQNRTVAPSRTKINNYKLKTSVFSAAEIKSNALAKVKIEPSRSSYVIPTTSARNVVPCVNTTLGKRKCDALTGSYCSDILQTRNNTTVAIFCPIESNKLNEDIKVFFRILEVNNVITDICAKSLKWLFCSVVYPQCNVTQYLYNLPCQEVCTVIEKTICGTNWKKIRDTERLLFKRAVLSSCSVLPDQNKSEHCVYPQFITDTGNTTKRKESSVKLSIYILVGSLVALASIIITICVVKRKRKAKLQRTMSLHEVKLVHREKPEDQIIHNAFEVLGYENPKYTSLGSLVDTLGIIVFGKGNLEFVQNLGEGAFGKVVKCRTKNIRHSMSIDMVAVKYFKENEKVEMEQTFQRELEILSNFNHANVIPLVGVCLDSPMCIILEFMKYGDLNEYIRLRSGSYHAVAGGYGNLPDGVEFQSPELSLHNLLSLTSQIADGVSYLALKRFVHRDIATRNILVGENLRVKISDFGLAHDIYGSDYYRVSTQKMLPLRWLPPEALSLGKFTIYSDIFSFGVTMWEIFTYGMQPFYGCDNNEVCCRIRCHRLLERPYCCPQNIYALMKVCWKFEPRQRKDCSFIRDTINTWLQNDEPFIQESWKRIMLPPLTERRPTILKSKKLHRIIKRDITL